MPTLSLFNKIKNDPRVSDVWDEGDDGWWADLKTNWISDDTETGRLHCETLESLYSSLIHGGVRLRHYEHEGGEITDGCAFDPDRVPFVRAEGRFLKLSGYQASILEDRPDCCIVEALENLVKDGVLKLSDEEIESEIASVKAMFKCDAKGQIKPVTIDTYRLTLAQRRVLEDCFSGSTVCGQMAEPLNPSEAAAYRNAVRSMHIIARKFSEVGLNSSFIPDA